VALEHRGDLLLFPSDRLLSRGETLEDVAVLGLQVGVGPLDLFAGRSAVARDVKFLVDPRDIVTVVNDEVTLAPVSEGFDPEIDIGLLWLLKIPKARRPLEFWKAAP
jgi:hypothetical protein